MSDSHFHHLSSISYIDLIGSGTSQFLKGQLTINADLLDAKTAKLAAFCNHKGRIVSLFHILVIDNGFRLLMPKSIVETSIAHIKKYAVFFKLEVIHDQKQCIFVSLDCNESRGDAVNINATDLSVQFDKINNSQKQQKSNETLWYWHMAEKSIPWLTGETVEHFLPHNLNLPALAAVDFNKGCFTGQEVIARMQYKGKLKQHLKQLKTSEIRTIMALCRLFQMDKNVAEVICAVSHQELGSLVLAIVKDSADKDKFFQLKLENTSILELKINE